jgi:rubrerythrin
MPTYKVVKELKAKGWPTANKRYEEAHEIADKKEKQKFGSKSYDYMKKVDSKLKKGQLAGKNTKTGKIEVSSKVPKKFRPEVAAHERTEYKELKKLANKKKK